LIHETNLNEQRNPDSKDDLVCKEALQSIDNRTRVESISIGDIVESQKMAYLFDRSRLHSISMAIIIAGGE
jgi:hypothetical protein